MQVRPLTPRSQHGKYNLKYLMSVDMKTFKLVKFYDKIGLLLNGAISVKNEFLTNLPCMPGNGDP